MSVPDCPPDYFARPEQVASDQRAVIAEAVRACGELTVVELSGLVNLAPDLVRRRLAEIARGA